MGNSSMLKEKPVDVSNQLGRATIRLAIDLVFGFDAHHQQHSVEIVFFFSFFILS